MAKQATRLPWSRHCVATAAAATTTIAATASALVDAAGVAANSAIAATGHMPAHQFSIDCCVRRLYLCHVDRAKEYLVLLFNRVVIARPVEDAAGGR